MSKWILLAYKLDREPTAPRMAVWRALRKLEGGYLQDGVYAVLASKLAEVAIASIAHDIRNYGGEALVLHVSEVDDERQLRAKIEAQAAGDDASSGRRPGTRR